MYTINEEHYGHLINNEDYNPMLKQPEFYQLLLNQMDWENRYLHRDYSELLKSNRFHQQPCPDVYLFPIVSDLFCIDLIKIVESFGKWSGGKNENENLAGVCEAASTRDVTMSEVGLEAVWLKFLKKYVRPLQETVFFGYHHNPPKSIMNFVVRHGLDEQQSLRPHCHSCHYTVSVVLNSVGIDYEGGGHHFLRYNCSVTSTQKGWMLLYPGRFTHYNEPLRIAKGVRYVMTSFVDP